MYINEKAHVYLVLEFPADIWEDPVIHGVYSTRQVANNKVLKMSLQSPEKPVYKFAVLKKTIEGPSLKYTEITKSLKDRQIVCVKR